MRAGFTLIELTVALTVAAASVTVGVRAVEFVRDRYASTNARAEAARLAVETRHTLRRWLAGAVVLPRGEGPPFQGLDMTVDSTPRDELRFLTVARTPAAARYSLVRIHVDVDSATVEDGLSAEVSAWPDGAPVRTTLDARVRSLDVMYATRDERAVRGWMSSALLPRALHLRFDPAGADDRSSAADPMTVVLKASQ